MDSFAIGVDLGATTVKSGIVDRTGNVLEQVTVDTKAAEGPATVIRQILRTTTELLSRHGKEKCAGLGIGSPGVVNLDSDTVSYPPNFAGWADVKLATAIAREYSFPVRVENDANAAALAEANYGAGKDHRDFLFVIWGTGIGGGVILDKKIFHGASGGAGEIGHVTIDYNGPDCNCGNRGCVESYIGQHYLSGRTKDLLRRMPKNSPPSKILQLVEGDLEKIEPFIISRAAEQGDATARQILKEAGALLGVALASALNILDLNIAVIGGGISAAPQFVFEAISDSIRSRVLEAHRPNVKVLRATLGNKAGIIGAASLVL